MKKNMRQSIVLAIALITVGVQAQESDDKKDAITIYAGLPGFGVGYAHKFNDHTAIRGAATFFSYKRDVTSDLELEVQDVSATAEAKFAFNKIDVLFDYTPFKASSFKLVAGLAYLYNGKLTIDAAPTTGKDIAGISFTKEELGTANGTVDWSGITPYVGLGFGRAVPKNNVGFGVEVGGYFIGKPDVSFTATGAANGAAAQEDIQAEADRVKTEIEDVLKIMPSIMFNVTIKI